ncbi:Uncharacterised protein [Legionella steigerwaltii]|uniref:Uncharacterized protein n=1 Tax=Legionella steigerwaltii TaxID=460 RepID=A0A378LBF3_9GAMM|nr:hypothetical protein [Legionella steigerwaltii]KTD78489.1 hypothetical protein Lstg_1224 [Legionella steigerwaltii]STY24153.1 Uncharacterised protein [Legionella steigerwaltii]
MRKKYESTTMGAPKREKKNVSWNDKKTEGKIDQEHLKLGEAASPTKKILDDQIAELQKTGYSELEATAIVGKAQTPSGTVIITEPIFYDSKEKIAERRFLAAQTHTRIGKEESSESEVIAPSSSSRGKMQWTQAITPKEKSPTPGSEQQGAQKESSSQENGQEKESEVNPYSFFSPTSIGVGVALAVVATLGIAAFKK